MAREAVIKHATPAKAQQLVNLRYCISPLLRIEDRMRHRRSMRASRQQEDISLSDANLIILAKRELAAFARAVKELFGPEEASLSSAEWIDELESLNWPAVPGASDFRRITVAASSRLAHRRLFRSHMGSAEATSSSASDQQ